MNSTDFFRRLQIVLSPMIDPERGGQIVVNVAPGGKIANVELRKVVKNPD